MPTTCPTITTGSQDIYDKVVNTLCAEGWQHENTGGGCMVLTYTTPDGTIALSWDDSDHSDLMTWAMAYYDGSNWDEGEDWTEGGYSEHYDVPQVLAIAREYLDEILARYS